MLTQRTSVIMYIECDDKPDYIIFMAVEKKFVKIITPCMRSSVTKAANRLSATGYN
jgi:hypothetical protein